MDQQSTASQLIRGRTDHSVEVGAAFAPRARPRAKMAVFMVAVEWVDGWVAWMRCSSDNTNKCGMDKQWSNG